MKIKSLGSSSEGNCYIISDGENQILLEAGISYTQFRQRDNSKLTRLEGALITHEHMDHCKMVDKLLKNAVYCYMSFGTRNALGLNHHRIINIQKKVAYLTMNYKFAAFEAVHDVAEPVYYMLQSIKLNETLVYITDTGKEPSKIFKNIDYFMIEANYADEIIDNNVIEGNIPAVAARRIKQNHLSIVQTINYLNKCDLTKTKAIILCHLSNGNSNEQLFIDMVQRATGKPTYVADRGVII